MNFDALYRGIRHFEGGGTPYAPKWDNTHTSAGYGSRWSKGPEAWAELGAEGQNDWAERSMRQDVANAARSVDSAFENLPDGWRLALTDLTQNVGPGWIEKSGLADFVRAGDWDKAAARLVRYNKAKGESGLEVQPGLVARRDFGLALARGDLDADPAAFNSPAALERIAQRRATAGDGPIQPLPPPAPNAPAPTSLAEATRKALGASDTPAIGASLSAAAALATPPANPTAPDPTEAADWRKALGESLRGFGADLSRAAPQIKPDAARFAENRTGVAAPSPSPAPLMAFGAPRRHSAGRSLSVFG